MSPYYHHAVNMSPSHALGKSYTWGGVCVEQLLPVYDRRLLNLPKL